jgi:tetratricopeptide (TPR) repeat protein
MSGLCRIVGVLLAASSAAMACVNTTYSRSEERRITNDLVYVILGSFADHGEAFYTDQVARNLKKLEADPKDVEARNDLAVAYLKLKKYDLAVTELDRIEAEVPGRYRTHANLGVLYKKKGLYTKAAHHIDRSLQIKPGGHLGLGDYYKKMAQYLQAVSARIGDDALIENNFLGVPYADGPEASAKEANKTYLINLIKADRHFADGLLALGDVLFVEGDLQLAWRAYERAKRLDHPNRDVIYKRLETLQQRWHREREGLDGYVVENKRALTRLFGEEQRAADAWVEKFQLVESEVIQAGQLATFDRVLSLMDEQGVARPVVNASGLVRGKASRSDGFGGTAFFLVAAAVLLLGGMLLIVAVGWWLFRKGGLDRVLAWIGLQRRTHEPPMP